MEWIGGGVSMLTTAEIEQCSLDTVLIGKRIKVFCSDMTFDATVNPVSYEGSTQIFIDSEYETWNITNDDSLRKMLYLASKKLSNTGQRDVEIGIRF